MAGLISSIIGSGQQSEADSNAAAVQQEILKNLQNIDVPTIGEQELQLALEKNQGQLSPQQEGTVKLDQNALNNITNDPRLVNAQMKALESLQQQGTEGLSASDKAALQKIENQLTQQASSQNQGTLQQFAQRGQGGSGANLAAELANNQNSANTANERALTIAGQAQQNALNATAQAGQLGQSMENQQYGQAYNKGQAQNAINQFNAQNSQNVMGTNTQAANQAQAYNLNNAQQIANQNVGLQNQQQQYNKGLYQQQFQNQLSKATGAVGAGNNLANTLAAGGAHANTNTQAIGQGVNQAGSSIATLFYDGGMVPGYDDGGTVMPTSEDWANLMGAPKDSSSTSNIGDKLKGFFQSQQPSAPQQAAPQQPAQAPQANLIADLVSKLKPKNSSIQMPNGQVVANSNNFGAPQLQLPGQQDANVPHLAKGGIPKPPKAGDAMSMFRMLNKGGEVPSKVSPGEHYLDPSELEKVEEGKVSPKKAGEKIPGKAKVKGDSPKNDTVEKNLAVGGLIIPRSMVHQSDDVIMDFIKAAKLHAKGGK